MLVNEASSDRLSWHAAYTPIVEHARSLLAGEFPLHLAPVFFQSTSLARLQGFAFMAGVLLLGLYVRSLRREAVEGEDSPSAYSRPQSRPIVIGAENPAPAARYILATDHAAAKRTTLPDSDVEISIIMPCLNEAETVGVCVEKALGFLAASGITGEVIIADNGSTDGSQQIAERLGARVVPVSQRGYGAALMGGILQARGRYVIMGDADDSYDFTNLMPYVTALREGNDLVMGNRFQGGIKPGAMPPLHRYLGNPVLTRIGRMFFKTPSRDFHCGLRGFARSAALQMDLRTTGMEFASELVVKASLFGMRVTEVPTTLSPDGRSRPPHLRSWRDGWRHLRFLLMYSPRWLFLYPGMAVMLIGMAVMIWLLPGTRRIGGVGLDIHTMIYAGLAVVVGFQAVVFAVFTKVFAISEGLLPADADLDNLFRYVTLEVGIIVGAAIAFIGVAGTAYAILLWTGRSFGPMDPAMLLRVVVPSGVCLTLGYQIVLSSFFLSILGLRRQKNATGPVA